MIVGARSPRSISRFSCLLGDPGSGGVCGDVQEVHAASGMLDYEQDVEPVK
jgi:hypothetical protein